MSGLAHTAERRARSPRRFRPALIALAALAVSAVSCAPAPPSAPAGGVVSAEVSETVRSAVPDGYGLVFSDEFEGESLDTEKWRTEMSWGATTTSELERYSPSALRVHDGILSIVASKAPGQARPYTSGTITTRGSFDFTYGYLEMRARIPAGKGLCPAFWTLCSNEDLHKEIDVTEVLGQQPYRSYMTYHYRVRSGSKTKYHTWYDGPDLSEGFHTYAVKWTPGRLVWYLDGVKRYEVADDANVPTQPMYLIANLAVGGMWPGAPDASTKFPAAFDIDYMRVYQVDEAGPGGDQNGDGPLPHER